MDDHFSLFSEHELGIPVLQHAASTIKTTTKSQGDKLRSQLAARNQRTFLSLRQNCVIVISRAFFSFHGVTKAFPLSFLPALLPKFRPSLKLRMHKT